MVSKHGTRLLDDDAIDALRRELMPQTTLLTPNLPEAAALLGGGALDREADLEAAARALVALGPSAVLVKGGHAAGSTVADLLLADGACVWMRSARIETRHTHGTGCTLSAAITARLAQGDDVVAAVRGARSWLRRAISGAPGLGAGSGPVDHWARTSPRQRPRRPSDG
jgi:hydroxymethylpyrimidine/phosphomethylpyrimidine kinase